MVNVALVAAATCDALDFAGGVLMADPQLRCAVTFLWVKAYQQADLQEVVRSSGVALTVPLWLEA